MIEDEISTLGQQVYRRLHRRLMSGALLPGAKLTLRGLAEELGTSMQPIREAVLRLAAEGALELAPNRLIRVPRLDRGQADELWSMRVLLEGYAAALFASRAEPHEITKLEEINDNLRVGYATRDWKRIMRDAQAWALTLAGGARAPLFEATIVNLRMRSAPHLAASLYANAPDDPAFFQFTVHIQDELVLAVRSRDAERARDLRRADLQTFQRYLYRRLGWHD
jgi:DNA-binding GntR family transcriptional regulator